MLFLIGYVLWKGIPNITWELLSTKPSYLRNQIGILPDILNTVYIVIATLLIVLPLGVGAAIYLTEYARNKKLVAVIEYAAETLSGIPSIIYGLVGMLFFCQFLNMQTSLDGGCADAGHHEPAHHHAHHAGKPENRAPELPGGRVRTGRGQVAGHPHGGAARLRGRRYHRLHSVRGPHSGRIGGAAVHGRVSPTR